jgi:hypothetical protein
MGQLGDVGAIQFPKSVITEIDIIDVGHSTLIIYLCALDDDVDGVDEVMDGQG